ncbi:translation initiation factor eIF-2B subunit beta [Danaus plexippus]|uniref:translation initiation factor eIF-2B subunit beta n=1 Tax=Danaus plexippus TaxID=13037 RepID=UPI002AAF19EB|nr:translation initiation factor eIF-2B subunit beta [Danaus plexippus]
MGPPEGMKELDEKSMESLVNFVADVRTGKVQGSENIALATVNLLEQIITDLETSTAMSLINAVRVAGRQLARALPSEHFAANMVRRVLRAVRDEQRAQHNQSVEGAGESLARLVLAAPLRRGTLPSGRDLREPLRDHIAELRAELDSSTSSICSQAKEHLHAEDLVLSYGGGALLEKFLKSSTRKYKLLLAAGPDVTECHSMAVRLSHSGVSVTVTSAAAVGALMSRVNKVVLEAVGALSGGSALAAAGTLALTTAAAHRAVPVVVLCPLHALCAVHACERRLLASDSPPAEAIPYQNLESSVSRVVSPKYDVLPPDHISLFITNLGGSSPSYIYRLLSEIYDPSDYNIF